MKKIKNLIKKLFLKASGIQRHVILAEHPKCGGTFLHSILNTLLAIEPDKIEHNNLSTYSYSPDLDMIPFYSYKNCLSNYSNKILVVKTHMNYVSTFNKVICLYRNPVDVFKSYFITIIKISIYSV